MLVVVADTGPLRYLVEIGQIELLPQLFEKIFVPEIVYAELCHSSAPVGVRQWAERRAGWLNVLPAMANDDPALITLDDGERAALLLGISIHADLILIDDRKGAAAALRNGFQVTGTLGVLTRAAQQNLVDLAAALGRLKETNFHYRQEMLDDILKKHGLRKP